MGNNTCITLGKGIARKLDGHCENHKMCLRQCSTEVFLHDNLLGVFCFVFFSLIKVLLPFLALLDSVSRAPGMGLQHVIHPSSPFTICVTVISEPIECISFKFQFYVALGLNQGGNRHF